MKLDISLDTAEIKQTAQERARSTATNLALRAIEQHFATGKQWGIPKGLGTLEIERQIDDLICGDVIAEQTRRIINEKFDAILEREIEYQITRKAKKLAAAAIKERENGA